LPSVSVDSGSLALVRGWKTAISRALGGTPFLEAAAVFLRLLGCLAPPHSSRTFPCPPCPVRLDNSR